MTLPEGLILFRFLCAPAILALTWHMGDNARPAILLLMYLGLASDILDGIIARRQQLSSARLRRLDSQTDMLFWLSIGVSTWLLYPKLVADHAKPIWAILGMETACYLVSLVKFGRETCTHAFLSKLWGVTLLVAFTALVGFNHAGIPFHLAIVMGLISHVDRILITLILPSWTHDIPSAYHACLIRRGIEFKRNPYLNG